MIKSENDFLFNRLKDKIGFHKSKKFKDWFHKEYPDKQMHHNFGSYTGIKTSDYCSIPVTQRQHEGAEKNKSDFAIDNLDKMLSVMIRYIIYLENK